MSRPEKHVFVCTHTRPSDHPKGCCKDRGGAEVANEFAQEFESRGLWGRFKLNTTSCLGVCEAGPAVLVYPEGTLYGKVQVGDVARIVDAHLLGGEPVAGLKVGADLWE